MLNRDFDEESFLAFSTGIVRTSNSLENANYDGWILRKYSCKNGDFSRAHGCLGVAHYRGKEDIADSQLATVRAPFTGLHGKEVSGASAGHAVKWLLPQAGFEKGL